MNPGRKAVHCRRREQDALQAVLLPPEQRAPVSKQLKKEGTHENRDRSSFPNAPTSSGTIY